MDWRIELPLLTQIKGHEKVFENVKSLELTNFPVLKTIEFMDYSFTNLEELTIRDNLALEKFAMGNNDPRVLKSIVLASSLWLLFSNTYRSSFFILFFY